MVISLFALETLAAAIFTFLQPALSGSQIREGFSLSRILILLVLAGVFGICLRFLISKDQTEIDKFRGISPFVQKSILFATYLITLILSTLLFFPVDSFSSQFQPYFSRFYYLLIFGSLFFAQLFIMVLFINKKNTEKTEKRLSFAWIQTAGWILFFFLLIWAVVSFTGIGNLPDTLGWRQLGAPLLTWQMWLAVFSGVGITLAGYLFPELATDQKKNATTLMLGLLIYILAVVVWNSQPVQTAYTAPRLREPNMERYPYSDSMYYSAAAESVLTGNGLLKWSVVPRPFFITILAYLTQLADGKFDAIVNLQTYLLAFIPVLLFLIGSRLLHNGLGFSVAIAAILRELTAIHSTSLIPVSHSRLILSDMPTLLVLLLFCWVLILWMKDHRKNLIWSILSGGTLGLLLLFRSQMVFLLPFVIILLVVGLWKKWKPLTTQSIGFILGMILVVSPWIIRNQVLSGQFAFDDQSTQTSVLLSRYQIDSADEDGSSTNNNDSIVKTILENPGFVAGFTMNHFLRNQIAVLLVTPPQPVGANLLSLFETTNFWKKSPLEIPAGTIWQIPILIILLSAGITFCVSRAGLIGWIPLVIEVAYSLSNGLARNSGGRYNLVIDWVGYFYIASGAIGIISWFVAPPLLNNHVHDYPQSSLRRKSLFSVVIGLVFLGSLIPITELSFPNQYKLLNLETAKQWAADLELRDNI